MKTKLFVIIGLWMSVGVANAAYFVVTTESDTGPGSLRQAILDANASPGADFIVFAIAPDGGHHIHPLSPLPEITDRVDIDGTTQPGFSGKPAIAIDGDLAGTGNGLVVRADACVLRSLAVNLFHGVGIQIHSSGNAVIGCFVGVDMSGDFPKGNSGSGIELLPSAMHNQIGTGDSAHRNVISDNDIGIALSGCFSNQVSGNYVGLNAGGNMAMGNGAGIDCSGGAHNTIGGHIPEFGNVISGNRVGLSVCYSHSNWIAANVIGTDPSGSYAIPNAPPFPFAPVFISGRGNLVGGTNFAHGNLISGNIGHGIRFGNLACYANGNVVQGNIIGLDRSMTRILPNTGSGVYFTYSSVNNRVGTQHPGDAYNIIVGNGEHGVYVQSGVSNRIVGNTIVSNRLLGISLSGSRPMRNDLGDVDRGNNEGQNYPMLRSATVRGGNLHVQVEFNSLPSRVYWIEIYINRWCDPSGHGEGEQTPWVGTITTDAGGFASTELVFPVVPPFFTWVTGTATDSGGNTSEFSPCCQISHPEAVGFATASVSVKETSSSASLKVVRFKAGTTLILNYATSNGLARAQSDYAPVSGTLTFSENDLEKSFSVPLLDDDIAEGEETFYVNLSGSANDIIHPRTVAVQIVDDEAPPMLRIVPSKDEVLLSWPRLTEGFGIEYADRLDLSGQWNWLGAQPQLKGDYLQVLTPAKEINFYRLRRD